MSFDSSDAHTHTNTHTHYYSKVWFGFTLESSDVARISE